MLAMGLLVVVVVAVAAMLLARQRATSRSDAPFGRTPRATTRPSSRAADPATHSAADLAGALDRAVAKGRLTRDVADAILADEAVVPAPVPGRRHLQHGVPATAESLGYVGGILALAGAAFLVGRAWHQIGQAGRLGILGGVALVLLAVGLALRNEADPILWRLRSFVWFLSTAATGGFAGVLAVDTFHWRGERAVITVASSISALSAVLWLGRDRPLQHATTLGGLLVAVGALMNIWDGGGAIGASIGLIGAVWALLGARALLHPQYIAVPLGLAAVLLGPIFAATEFPRWAPLVGLAVAIGLVVLGSLVHQFVVTGAGVLGLMIFLPFSITRWFGNTLKAPGVMLVSGVLLLAVTLVIVKRRRGQLPPRPAGV
jgi:hypothetical protein